MKYFLANSVAYEQARAALNAAWDIPRPGTSSCLPAAGECLNDQAGNVYVCVDDWMCELHPAPDILASALDDGAVREVSEKDVLDASRRLLPQP